MKNKRININVTEEYHKTIKQAALDKGISVTLLIMRGLAMVIHKDKNDKN